MKDLKNQKGNVKDSGVAQASMRNPNKHPMLNETPDGPYAHLMGSTMDGGIKGKETTTGKNNNTFHFK